MPRLQRLLSPAKISTAARRRWFERQLADLPVTGYAPLVHLGSDWSGWDIPDDLVKADWTAYCVGAGDDVSFDLELIARYGCLARTFDPSEEFRDRALAQAAGDPRFSFLAVAVSPEDGPLRMYDGEDPSVDYHSAANLFGTKPVAEFPGRTLPSLMQEYGDEHLDLLKLDVEGLEYEVLRDLDLAELGVRILCVELHHTASVRDAHELLDDLEHQGFRLVHHRRPANLSFVRN
jgi:FkbM family methyltransferase